jgi:arylsulfatase A-like enzyme
VSRPLRSTFILGIAALGTALAAVGGWRYARASAPVPGPVILISIDTLRADHLPVYGYRAIKTPAIDSLANDGVVFERAYTHSTQTLPSHAAMMTGRLPFENGVRDDDATLGADERPLAQMLRERGYTTGGIVSSGLLRRTTGLARGFDFFDDDAPAGDGDLPPGFRRRSGPASEDIAERWLSGLGTMRLFLFLHIDEPRAPRAPSYDDAITAADAVVGRFVRYLKEHQLYDQSTILLVSDHGEGLGDHGEQEHGLLVYNEAIHVPMIVKPASGGGAGRRVADVVQLADIAPTVLDLVKAPQPGNLRGRSLKPLTEGGSLSSPALVYTESTYGRTRFGWSDLVAVTDGQFQYIRAPHEELYDLRGDLRERENLIDGDVPAKKRDELRDALKSIAGAPKPSREGETPADPREKTATVEEFRAAVALVADRKWPQAIELLQKITRAEPSAVAAWRALADVAALAERYDVAQGAAQHLVELTSDDASQFVVAARVALAAHKLDDATSYAMAALDLGSKDVRVMADAHIVLALVSLAQDDRDMARSEALAARQSDRNSVLPLFVDAQMRANDGEVAEALPILEKANATAAAAQSAPLQNLKYLTADVLMKSDRGAEAETFLLDELRDFPHNLKARAALATLYQSMGQTEDAARAAADLVRVTPSPESYAMAAKLWTSLGDKKQAAAVRADAKRLFPTRRNAH